MEALGRRKAETLARKAALSSDLAGAEGDLEQHIASLQVCDSLQALWAYAHAVMTRLLNQGFPSFVYDQCIARSLRFLNKRVCLAAQKIQ